MNFKTYKDLDFEIIKNLPNIRKQGPFDLVVGIPRSGITPAAIISLHLQIPYADLTSYTNNLYSDKHGIQKQLTTEQKKILLVDDTVNTGKSIREALSHIRKTRKNDTITTFAVWSSELTKTNEIDIVCDHLQRPRLFEWNIWKNDKVKFCGFDMDGVLCRDPEYHENDKGQKLIEFYKTADPKFIPLHPVKYIITNRLSHHREITEKWLSDHNIKYQQLFMKEDKKEPHIDHKTRRINQLGDMKMYIESDSRQAEKISKNVKIPVWCTDNQTLYKRK